LRGSAGRRNGRAVTHDVLAYGRRYDDLPSNVATGIPSLEICARRWRVPTAYRLRLRSMLGAGPALAVTVAHRYWLDDGLGDGERLITLTTSLASGLAQESYQVVEGVALNLRVRVETVPDSAPTTGRSCSNAAAISEIS